MKKVFFALFLLSLLFAHVPAYASVVPAYATNNYQNHELTRAEKKCLEEGYKITYANCSNQTAPADRCPHHDAYYRSCSQEQWCRNNNYRFLAEDCKLPLYPVKMCDNKFPLYRSCQENVVKACTDSGYKSKDSCKLTDKKCPYTQDFGICCDKCPNFAYRLDNIPEGYIADGETCTTCDDVVMTNVIPAACDGYHHCKFGPMSPQTPSCRHGEQILYSACKTADMVCQENGFTSNTCSPTEDTRSCPQNPSFKRCTTNCLKLARKDYANADVIADNSRNPTIDLTKTELRSLVGMSHPDCRLQNRPTVELNINQKNLEQYRNLFDRQIDNMAFVLHFEEPVSLPANGKFNNVKISVDGNLADCPLTSDKTVVSGTVNFIGAPKLCMNFDVKPESKLLTDGTIQGNIDLGKDSALGIKGDLRGYLKAKGFTEIFIKGRLEYADPANSNLNDESIVFGCNSKVKIGEGIFVDTAFVIIKPWTKMDVAKIELKSTSDNINLPNSLSAIHLYKYAKLFSNYGTDGNQVVFPLVENDATNECEDKYYIHLGSAVNTKAQVTSLEPTNLLEGKWQCRKLEYKQQLCD